MIWLAALLFGGAAVAVAAAVASDSGAAPEPRPARLPIITPLVFKPAIPVPPVTAGASDAELRAAFAKADARGQADREAQFKANRDSAAAQAEDWGGYVGAGKLASWVTYYGATLTNAIAGFLGLYAHDWNSDENVARARRALDRYVVWGIVPRAFSDHYAGALEYAELLERDLAELDALGPAFRARWQTFVTWYAANPYNAVRLNTELVRESNGAATFPAELRQLAVSRATAASLGRLLAAERGKNPEAGMTAAVRAFDLLPREVTFLGNNAKAIPPIVAAVDAVR